MAMSTFKQTTTTTSHRCKIKWLEILDDLPIFRIAFYLLCTLPQRLAPESFEMEVEDTCDSQRLNLHWIEPNTPGFDVLCP